MRLIPRIPFAALGALLLLSTGCPKDDDDSDAGTAGTGGQAVAGQAAGSGTGGHSNGGAHAAGAGGKTAGGAGAAGAANGGAGGKASAGTGGSVAGGPAAGGGGGGGNPAAGTGGSSDEDAGVSQNGQLCGTRGAGTCGDKQFCDFGGDPDCGGTDRGGACTDKPEVCPAIYAPVCGCDKRTWASDCAAHGGGISVLHTGACTTDECTAAGGRVELSDGASTPECKQGEESWDVGPLDEPARCCLPKQGQDQGATCAGFANLQCGANLFCNLEEAAGGQGCNNNIADGGGTCQVIPQSCTREYKPVCGCDRHTYATDCIAHSENASVFHDGACTVTDCEALGGRAVAGIGPAPMCASDEHEETQIVNDDGSIAIEGMVCCVKN